MAKLFLSIKSGKIHKINNNKYVGYNSISKLWIDIDNLDHYVSQTLKNFLEKYINLLDEYNLRRVGVNRYSEIFSSQVFKIDYLNSSVSDIDRERILNFDCWQDILEWKETTKDHLVVF